MMPIGYPYHNLEEEIDKIGDKINRLEEKREKKIKKFEEKTAKIIKQLKEKRAEMINQCMANKEAEIEKFQMKILQFQQEITIAEGIIADIQRETKKIKERK